MFFDKVQLHMTNDKILFVKGSFVEKKIEKGLGTLYYQSKKQSSP